MPYAYRLLWTDVFRQRERVRVPTGETNWVFHFASSHDPGEVTVYFTDLFTV